MDVTDVIGSMGRTQMNALFAMLLRPLPGAFVLISMQLSLIQLDHWCSPPPEYQNLTSDEWKECCVPRTDSGRYSSCQYYDMENEQNGSHTLLTCSSWDYDRTSNYQSSRADWNLVCDRGWYVSIIYVSFVIGNLLFYIPSGYLADRFGRKPICLVASFLAALVTLGSAFCQTVEQMLITRFLTGMTFAAVQNSFICLYLECVGQKHRYWFVLSYSTTWGLFIIVVAGLSYFITSWRTLFIIGSFPVQIPVLLVLWRLVPESARWLLSVKKYEQAEKVILQQTKDNGIVLEDIKSTMEQLKKKVELDKEKQGNVSFMDLLKNRSTLKTTLVLLVTFVFTVFINHGYVIAIGHLGGSLHVNLMINGALDMSTLILYFTLLKYTSKRRGLFLSFALTGTFFLLTIPIGDDMRWLRVMLAMLGRFCNETSYNLLYVSTSELFPTSLRAVGVSVGMSSGRIGSILAAFTDDLGRVYGRNVPITLFGILALFTSGILLLLPEQTGVHLPDSLVETKMAASGKALSEAVEMRTTSSPD